MTKLLYNTGLKSIEKNVSSDFTVLNVPLIEVNLLHPQNSDEIKICLSKNPILVFQSKNGVEGFSKWMDTQKDVIYDFSGIYATGFKTAQAVSYFLNKTARVPKDQNALGLLKELRTKNKQPVLMITGTQYRPDVITGLSHDGWDITQAMVYQTLPIMNYDLQSTFKNTQSEYILFTSPLTVDGFLKTTKMNNLTNLNSKILTIGPTTSKRVIKMLGSVYFEAPTPNISSALLSFSQKLKNNLKEKI